MICRSAGSPDEVIGHQRALSALHRAFEKGMPSHAYLITGPAHVGRMKLAMVIAQLLNCSGDDPTGTCEQCARIRRGVHADVTIVPVDSRGSLHEDRRPRTMTTIEQVRAVSREAALQPFEGRCRVFVFEQADRLTEEASNALLKTLEEPPDQVSIVLVASGEEAVLPTIVSRCRLVCLRPVSWPLLSEELVRRLGLPTERALQIARTSGGRPGLALRMATDEVFGAGLEESLDRIEAAVAADLEGRFEYAASLARLFAKDREAARNEMVHWRHWWRDVLLACKGLDEFVGHVSRASSIRSSAAAVGTGGAIAGLRASIQAAKRLDMNVGASLAIEQMMLSMPQMARR